MNIVCVKWGDKYSPAFVNKLFAMVKKIAADRLLTFTATPTIP